jgi:hypothetical protein
MAQDWDARTNDSPDRLFLRAGSLDVNGVRPAFFHQSHGRRNGLFDALI